MKKLPLYLFITVFVYVSIFLSKSFLVKYLSFSTLIYPIMIGITLLCLYIVLNLFRQKSCFTFNKLAFISTIVAIFSLSISTLLDYTHNSERVFEYEVLSINKKLPLMIDKSTRFDRAYIKDNNIFYEYTLVNTSSKKANIDFITLALTDKIYSSASLDKMMLKLSKKQRVINYIYKDKDKNLLTKVEVKLK